MSTFGLHLKLQQHETARFEFPIRVPVRRHERRRSAARNTAFCCLGGSSPISTAWVAARSRQQGLDTTHTFVHMLPGQIATHTFVAPHCLTGGACLHRSGHKAGADKGEGDAAAHLPAEKLAAMRLRLHRQGACRRCAEPRQRARCVSRIGSFTWTMCLQGRRVVVLQGMHSSTGWCMSRPTAGLHVALRDSMAIVHRTATINYCF